MEMDKYSVSDDEHSSSIDLATPVKTFRAPTQNPNDVLYMDDPTDHDARVVQLLRGPNIAIKCHHWHHNSLTTSNDMEALSNLIYKPGTITQLCSFNETATYEFVHTLRGLRKFPAATIEATFEMNGVKGTCHDYTGFKDLMPKLSIHYDSNDSLIGSMKIGDLLRERAKVVCCQMSKDDREMLLEWICRKLDLTSLINQVVGDSNKKSISTGQRRRVSLALLLLHRPRVLFLNNALVGLDNITANRLVRLLRDDLAIGANCTVVLTGSDVPPIHWHLVDNIHIMSSHGTIATSDKETLVKLLCGTNNITVLRLLSRISGHQQLINHINSGDHVPMGSQLVRIASNLCTIVAETLEQDPSLIEQLNSEVVPPLPEEMELGMLLRSKQDVGRLVRLASEHMSCSRCDDSEDHSSLCPRCWFGSCHWQKSGFMRQCWSCFTSHTMVKVTPIKNYFAAILCYITLGAILGYIFFDIPGRIDSNPGMELVDYFYEVVSPALSTLEGSALISYLNDTVRLIKYGVGGTENATGPHPIMELFMNGVDGSGRYPIRDLVTNKMTYLKLRCFTRCLYTNLPFNRAQFGYPSADMTMASLPNDITRLKSYSCPEDASDLTMKGILQPDETLTDIVALTQVIHFALTQIDYQEVFPGLDESMASDAKGLNYWLAIVMDAHGLVNVAVDCLGLPALPCVGTCNEWPAYYQPCDPMITGDCDPVALPLEFKNGLDYLSISQEQLEENLSELSVMFSSLLSNYESDNNMTANDDTPFKWSEKYTSWLLNIFPINWKGAQLMSSIVHPLDYQQNGSEAGTMTWSGLFESIETFVNVVNDKCKATWCRNFSVTARNFETGVWNMLDILWQILNTTGFVFAVNAGIPFFTMDGLLTWNSQYKRYKADVKHHTYGTLAFSVAQLLADVLFSLLPLLIFAMIWCGMGGVLFTWGIAARTLLTLSVMVFSFYSFSYMIGCIIERSEVSLVVCAFSYIMMLLYSGFILRNGGQESFQFNDIIETFALHRWSYFALMLNFFPPSCASSWTSAIKDEISIPHYGLINHELMLWLSGVPSSCSPVTYELSLVWLFVLGWVFRVIAVVVLHWKKYD